MDSAYQQFEHATLNIISLASQRQPISADIGKGIFELSQCYEDLRKRVIAFAFTAGCSKKIELLVHQLLRQLVQLAEKLNKHPSGRKTLQVSQALHAASQKVEEALTFLETNFPQYLNMQEKIPPGYKKLLRREMKIRLQELQTLLQQYGIPEAYTSIILQPAHVLVDSKEKIETTYHHAWYLKRMYCEMELVLQSTASKDLRKTLNDFLIGINFNSPLFIKYMADQLSLSLMDATNAQAQIETLSLSKKQLLQLFQTCNKPYISTMAGARESLLSWIECELNHLEKMQQMALIMPPQPEAFVKQPVLNTSLSVPELAALFRVMVERKILEPDHTQDLFNLVSKLVKTKSAQVISAKSFKNNFYEISARTAGSVKAEILELFNEVRKFE